MRKTWAVVVAVAALCNAPAWGVNKCTGPDGKVIYQAAPCQGGAAGATVNLSGAGTAQPDSAGSRYWRSEVERQEWVTRVQNAIATGYIIVGMTASEAVRAWGRPTKVNVSVGRYGRHEQWVYDRGDYRSQYVYVENGAVTSMQGVE